MHKFWESSNFWIATILAIGGLFVGFPEGEGRTIAAGLFGIIGAAGVLSGAILKTSAAELSIPALHVVPPVPGICH